MTDQTTETPAAEPASDETRIDKLEGKVDRILEMLSGQGQPQADAEPETDPKAEMKAELAKLQRAERAKAQRQAERDANDARLKAVEDKLKEKPPREHKRSTNFMRWRGDDDK